MKNIPRYLYFPIPLLLILIVWVINFAPPSSSGGERSISNFLPDRTGVIDTIPIEDEDLQTLMNSLRTQIDSTLSYDPSYVPLDYPGGDVPLGTGVCADVVVRALRTIGTDLQVEIHNDMKNNFRNYPQLWGLRRPDKNIDHRRVPNQMTFFKRQGKELDLSDSSSYQPGDIVAWMLPGDLYHIGLVSNLRDTRTGRLLVVHNIGRGAELQDVLFAWEVIGHYRWKGRVGEE